MAACDRGERGDCGSFDHVQVAGSKVAPSESWRPLESTPPQTTIRAPDQAILKFTRELSGPADSRVQVSVRGS